MCRCCLLKTSSRREVNKSKSCLICVLDKRGSAPFEIAPTKGSPKGTQRQNSSVNKSVIGLENHAPPPLGVLSERPNTSGAPRLVPPKAGANTFIPVSPCLPLNLSFIPFQMRLTIYSHLFRMMIDFVSLQSFKAPIFTSTPSDDGVADY